MTSSSSMAVRQCSAPTFFDTLSSVKAVALQQGSGDAGMPPQQPPHFTARSAFQATPPVAIQSRMNSRNSQGALQHSSSLNAQAMASPALQARAISPSPSHSPPASNSALGLRPLVRSPSPPTRGATPSAAPSIAASMVLRAAPAPMPTSPVALPVAAPVQVSGGSMHVQAGPRPCSGASPVAAPSGPARPLAADAVAAARAIRVEVAEAIRRDLDDVRKELVAEMVDAMRAAEDRLTRKVEEAAREQQSDTISNAVKMAADAFELVAKQHKDSDAACNSNFDADFAALEQRIDNKVTRHLENVQQANVHILRTMEQASDTLAGELADAMEAVENNLQAKVVSMVSNAVLGQEGGTLGDNKMLVGAVIADIEDRLAQERERLDVCMEKVRKDLTAQFRASMGGPEAIAPASGMDMVVVRKNRNERVVHDMQDTVKALEKRMEAMEGTIESLRMDIKSAASDKALRSRVDDIESCMDSLRSQFSNITAKESALADDGDRADKTDPQLGEVMELLRHRFESKLNDILEGKQQHTAQSSPLSEQLRRDSEVFKGLSISLGGSGKRTAPSSSSDLALDVSLDCLTKEAKKGTHNTAPPISPTLAEALEREMDSGGKCKQATALTEDVNRQFKSFTRREGSCGRISRPKERHGSLQRDSANMVVDNEEAPSPVRSPRRQHRQPRQPALFQEFSLVPSSLDSAADLEENAMASKSMQPVSGGKAEAVGSLE